MVRWTHGQGPSVQVTSAAIAEAAAIDGSVGEAQQTGGYLRASRPATGGCLYGAEQEHQSRLSAGSYRACQYTLTVVAASGSPPGWYRGPELRIWPANLVWPGSMHWSRHPADVVPDGQLQFPHVPCTGAVAHDSPDHGGSLARSPLPPVNPYSAALRVLPEVQSRAGSVGRDGTCLIRIRCAKQGNFPNRKWNPSASLNARQQQGGSIVKEDAPS